MIFSSWHEIHITLLSRYTHTPYYRGTHEIHITLLSRYTYTVSYRGTHHPPIEIHIYSILSRYASPSYRDTHIQYSIEVRITLLSRYTYTVSYRGTHHPPIEIHIYSILSRYASPSYRDTHIYHPYIHPPNAVTPILKYLWTRWERS
jgi:hypothetical protein